MPSFNSQSLLGDLSGDLRALLNVMDTRLLVQSDEALLRQPAPGSWSAAQCLEHLNGYGRYYIPALEGAIRHGEEKQLVCKPVFRSGWLGNYFTSLMKPREDGALRSKMQSPKDHRPVTQLDVPAVTGEFVRQQHALLQLLERAEKVDIGKLKVPISLSKFVKLSAGDTFRFLIAHEQRHMLQALRSLQTGEAPMRSISPGI